MSNAIEKSSSELVEFSGWQIATGFPDHEPRVLDLEIGRRLGLERPRVIRELIARLDKSGAFKSLKTPEIHVSRTARRTSMPRGGERSVETEEFMLTEQQALIVAAKSETAKANEVTAGVVEVFVALRRGELQASPMNAQLAQVDVRLDSMRRQLEGISNVVLNLQNERPGLVLEVQRLKKSVARLIVADERNVPTSERSAMGRIQSDMGDLVGHKIMAQLSRDELMILKRWLEKKRERLIDKLTPRDNGKQVPLNLEPEAP